MIERLLAWWGDGRGEDLGERDGLKLAVAALLVEAAQVADDISDVERAAIERLLAKQFSLSREDAHRLEATAERKADESVQIFGFIRTINERFSRERRVELIEMLWEVAYADGRLDPLEDMLLRRIGGLIDVSDHERGEARLTVLRRLGLETAEG